MHAFACKYALPSSPERRQANSLTISSRGNKKITLFGSVVCGDMHYLFIFAVYDQAGSHEAGVYKILREIVPIKVRLFLTLASGQVQAIRTLSNFFLFILKQRCLRVEMKVFFLHGVYLELKDVSKWINICTKRQENWLASSKKTLTINNNEETSPVFK